MSAILIKANMLGSPLNGNYFQSGLQGKTHVCAEIKRHNFGALGWLSRLSFQLWFQLQS